MTHTAPSFLNPEFRNGYDKLKQDAIKKEMELAEGVMQSSIDEEGCGAFFAAAYEILWRRKHAGRFKR
jgi:hypothetical protein